MAGSVQLQEPRCLSGLVRLSGHGYFGNSQYWNSIMRGRM
jgi:hypothetical protein